ncbi:MAG: hypothetical protein OEW39_00015 [Deltaproteobacteria bacterium]|nr:hypothetical protein [Deltaproteobacteria bacterium]
MWYRPRPVAHRNLTLQQYLVIDLWDTEAQASQAEIAHEELLATLAEWVESSAELGDFSIQAQGTVRPVENRRRRKG